MLGFAQTSRGSSGEIDRFKRQAMIQADRSRFQQLLSNAIRHHQKRSPGMDLAIVHLIIKRLAGEVAGEIFAVERLLSC
jgi:hypothetical protein